MYKKALELIKWQAILGIVPVALCFFYAGTAAGISALYGLSIVLVANNIVAFFLFRRQGALAAAKIIRLFYLGEALKIVVIFLMFGIAIVSLKLSFLPLILCFMLSQFVWCFCPLLANKRINAKV